VSSLVRELERLKENFGLILRHRMGLVGVVVLVFFGVIAIFAPYLRTVDPARTGLAINVLKPPSSEFWFGTDHLARDIWSQTIYGTRIALTVGFFAAGVTVFIGTLIGLLGGYFGGRFEEVLMRIVDFFMLLPSLPLMIILAALLGPSIWNIVLVIGITYWPWTARVIRSQVLSIKERAFVEASRSIGAGDPLLIFGEIMPNVVPLIFAQVILLVTEAIYAEAVLAFLGLGDPRTISWGMMLNFAFESGVLHRKLYWVIPPLTCIVVLIVSLTFLGTAISDILKPGYREARGL